MASGMRQLKREMKARLRSRAFLEELHELSGVSLRRMINPLFSFLCDADEIVRWRAVTAFGEVVSRLAEQDVESARVIVRRLIWNLNDESGGIGWGAPEAMGEIMARHGGMAAEYFQILLAYIREDGNFLEHEPLQAGVLWGLARVAEIRPECFVWNPTVHVPAGEAGRSPAAAEAAFPEPVPHILPFLDAGAPELRGLAARLLGLIGAAEAVIRLERLLDDGRPFRFYDGIRVSDVRVKDQAAEAMERIRSRR